MNDIKCGTIITTFPKRSFGFIRDDESGLDVFVHVSGFAGKLNLPKGTRVYFRIVPHTHKNGGYMATDVRPIVAPVSSEVTR